MQVLATLILLSFTKIFRTFAPALSWIHNSWVKLSCVELDIKYYVYVVHGWNVPYFSSKHYILMAAAVLFLLLAVPYTLALLFDAVIEKYLTRISSSFVDSGSSSSLSLMPTMDLTRTSVDFGLVYCSWFVCRLPLASLYLKDSIVNTSLIFITTSTTVLTFLVMVTFEGSLPEEANLNMLRMLIFSSILILLSAIYSIFA